MAYTIGDIIKDKPGLAPLQKGLMKRGNGGIIFTGEWKGKVVGKKIKV